MDCRHQAIIWTNTGILLIRTLASNLSEIVSAYGFMCFFIDVIAYARNEQNIPS